MTTGIEVKFNCSHYEFYSNTFDNIGPKLQGKNMCHNQALNNIVLLTMRLFGIISNFELIQFDIQFNIQSK